MKFSHYVFLHGVRVLVHLDINVDALANDLGAKAADNKSGKAAVRFGNVKASIGHGDRDNIRHAKMKKRQASAVRTSEAANARDLERADSGTPAYVPKFMRCDQCEMVSVNGMPTHEHGCINRFARFDVGTGEWVKQWTCNEGCQHDAGVQCDCLDHAETNRAGDGPRFDTTSDDYNEFDHAAAFEP